MTNCHLIHPCFHTFFRKYKLWIILFRIYGQCKFFYFFKQTDGYKTHQIASSLLESSSIPVVSFASGKRWFHIVSSELSNWGCLKSLAYIGGIFLSTKHHIGIIIGLRHKRMCHQERTIKQVSARFEFILDTYHPKHWFFPSVLLIWSAVMAHYVLYQSTGIARRFERLPQCFHATQVRGLWLDTILYDIHRSELSTSQIRGADVVKVTDH